MKIPLHESASVIANGNGEATVRLSPQTAGSSWQVKRMVTVINVPPDTVINLAIYLNSVSEANRLDGTQSAAQDTSETDIRVGTTDALIGFYTGVPVGALCTLTITGDKETGRER